MVATICLAIPNRQDGKKCTMGLRLSNQWTEWQREWLQAHGYTGPAMNRNKAEIIISNYLERQKHHEELIRKDGEYWEELFNTAKEPQ